MILAVGQVMGIGRCSKTYLALRDVLHARSDENAHLLVEKAVFRRATNDKPPWCTGTVTTWECGLAGAYGSARGVEWGEWTWIEKTYPCRSLCCLVWGSEHAETPLRDKPELDASSSRWQWV